MKLTGAEALIKGLEKEGVSKIFGYIGAANVPIYEELSKSKIKHILMRHEQAAAHAADGYARVTGKPGICMATSGPGATNLITGIATAYMDSVPIVAITGQVSTEMVGRDVFQEVDITGATAPFCKHNYLIKDAKQIPKIIKEAFYIASTGRPGPVLIDIPIDIQQKEIEYEEPKEIKIRGYKPNYKGNEMQIKRLVEAIDKSQKPLICAGGGIIKSRAGKEFIQMVEELQIPVITTMMGIGTIAKNHPLCIGMLGTHGVRAANIASDKADLLIVMGARVADRATVNLSNFAPSAKIIHIDIDPAEIGKNIGTNIPIVGDIKTVLQQIKKEITAKQEPIKIKHEWIQTITKWKQEDKIKLETNIENHKTEKTEYVNAKYLIKQLSQLTKGDPIITTEVGQNQIWAANNYTITKPGTFITSGGLGTMGYGLPAAIGAKIGAPKKEVISISGDGSIQMSLQELATIKQWDVDIKIILLNNKNLGMVRELQKKSYKSNYFAVELDGSPDFQQIAAAYNIAKDKINKNSQVEKALREMLEHKGPYILEVQIDPEESTL